MLSFVSQLANRGCHLSTQKTPNLPWTRQSMHCLTIWKRIAIDSVPNQVQCKDKNVLKRNGTNGWQTFAATSLPNWTVVKMKFNLSTERLICNHKDTATIWPHRKEPHHLFSLVTWRRGDLTKSCDRADGKCRLLKKQQTHNPFSANANTVACLHLEIPQHQMRLS